MIRLGVAHFTPNFRQPAESRERLLALVEGHALDVLVLPELCHSGYFFTSPEDARPFALTPAGFAAWLEPIQARTGALVVAGFLEEAGASLFNSALLTHPAMEPLVYRKTHLFYREKQVFAPGDTGFFVVAHPVVDLKIGTMICYDWRFPEAARTLALAGADLIACPANLVTQASRIGFPARALENHVFLAVSNRSGTETQGEESLTFGTTSCILDPRGQRVAESGADDELLTFELDVAIARDKAFNALNHPFADRRPELYRI